MKPGHFNRKTLFLLILLLLVVAACDEEIPPAPFVTVEVTVVENEAALEAAVAQAVSGTESAALAQTATVFAQGGVTLTPSFTPTPSVTPTPEPTRFMTATRTPLPSETPTATFAPFETITPPGVVAEDAPSWIRVLNAWRNVPGQQLSVPVDVYVNDERISRALDVGAQTTYIQVNPGQVRLNLRTVDSNLTPTPPAPLISEVVNIPAGAVMSFLAVDLGRGLTFLPIQEDLTPITSGMARLTVVQANPELIPVDMQLSVLRRSLASDLDVGQSVGPMELPSSIYNIDLFDAGNAVGTLQELTRIDLTARLNYILVLAPFRGQGQDFTSALLFPGITRLLDTDLSARFINIATRRGPLTISIDGNPLFTSLPVGALSPAIPISALGSNLIIEDNDSQFALANTALGPWTAETERNTDKIILISDNTGANASVQPITVTALSQNPPSSAINANLRIIHALPGGIPVSLEIRRVVPSATQTTGEIPWVSIAQASLGSASSYVSRTPDVVDVRVVQAGTRTPLAQLPSVQLLAGGVYDFVVLPGTDVGSARLEIIQPSVQITSLAGSGGDADFINEAVQATLQSLIPDVTATPTGASTSTPTLTPVSTNTPRPTNTPSVLLPVLTVDPVPPNATSGVITIIGQNFAPGKAYSVRVDNITVDLANGVVSNNGTIGEIITLPANLSPGPHTIRVCVDCLSFNGLKQEQFAVVILAESNVTPTATARP